MNWLVASICYLEFFRNSTAEFYPENGVKADDFFPSQGNIHDKILY